MPDEIDAIAVGEFLAPGLANARERLIVAAREALGAMAADLSDEDLFNQLTPLFVYTWAEAFIWTTAHVPEWWDLYPKRAVNSITVTLTPGQPLRVRWETADAADPNQG